MAATGSVRMNRAVLLLWWCVAWASVTLASPSIVEPIDDSPSVSVCDEWDARTHNETLGIVRAVLDEFNAASTRNLDVDEAAEREIERIVYQATVSLQEHANTLLVDLQRDLARLSKEQDDLQEAIFVAMRRELHELDKLRVTHEFFDRVLSFPPPM